jgi:hypothetical protein
MRRFSALVLLLLIPIVVSAQDIRNEPSTQQSKPEIKYVTGTFRSTRVLNGHSVERQPAGQLDVRISHRFGTLNQGAYGFFGLDQSNIHLSLEYGILDWLMVGAGRGSFEKTFDGFAKFTLLRQSSGARVMPVSVSWFSSMAINSLKWSDPSRTNYFSSRLSFVNQVLVARKINQAISVQITPSFVHRNLVATELDPNDIWSVGTGASVRLTPMISLNAEYYYIANSKQNMSQRIYDPLSIGIDIDTGGHVFQLFFTNSVAMIEKSFIAETTGSWKKGDIHFGFNISRLFTINTRTRNPDVR